MDPKYGLAYRMRVIPISWIWINHIKGHSRSDQQLALLKYIRGLIPKNAPVLLVFIIANAKLSDG